MNEYIKKRIIAIKSIKPIIEENEITKQSGIYLYHRVDEKGINYFYCGQAINVFERQISHWNGWQRIDISMRKRKFYNNENKYGWNFKILEFCKNEDLNEKEQQWIEFYMKKGWQTYNSNYGGNAGKTNTFDKGQGGYKKGVAYGYEKARKEIAHLFEKNLTFDMKKATIPNKKAYYKFLEFLKGSENNEN